MIAPAMPDIDLVGAQATSATEALQSALRAHGRIRPWVNVLSAWRGFFTVNSKLQLLRLRIREYAADDIGTAQEWGKTSELLSKLLSELQQVRDIAVSPDSPYAYRLTVRWVDALLDDVDDLQETTALASSTRFREFVERSLETA